MTIPENLRCRPHGERFALGEEGDGRRGRALRCARGCAAPLVGEIPRFVEADEYATAFGIQWNTYRKTQLDSYTGLSLSRARLSRCLGGSLDALRGARVLEVGCGAGRFTEILLEHGASVCACDLSSAVEANRANCGERAEPGSYFVMQADVNALPTEPHSFDLVLALGMIQHTPSPEATIRALAQQVKQGGLLVIDHYTLGTRGAFWRLMVAVSPRSMTRRFLLRLAPARAFALCTALTRALIPLHRAFWRPGAGAKAARRFLHLVSPLFDYYDKLPQLSTAQLEEWSFLDTHDGLTDRYKHFRSREQIDQAVRASGFAEVSAVYAGNGVEARGRLH